MLKNVQEEQKTWAVKNFGHQPGWRSILGVMEEVGELAHAYLKNDQGIRISENHDEQMNDAVGDIVIYLADFCNNMGIDLEQIVSETWATVKKRDWTKNRINGEV